MRRDNLALSVVPDSDEYGGVSQEEGGGTNSVLQMRNSWSIVCDGSITHTAIRVYNAGAAPDSVTLQKIRYLFITVVSTRKQ